MNPQADADFAAATPRWWSIAAQWLGWRPVEFWRATPAELLGALREPQGGDGLSGPARKTIARMLERENNG